MAYNFSTFPNAIFICLLQFGRNPVSIDDEFDSDSTRASEGKRGYMDQVQLQIEQNRGLCRCVDLPASG